MLSLNKVIVAGVVADDPVVREVKEGRKIIGKMVGLSVITKRRWQDPNSKEARDGQEYHRVVIMNQRLAKTVLSEIQRNDHVYIEGELHTEFWRDETFEWRSLTRIILWQEDDKVKRLNDEEQAKGPHTRQPPILEAARKIHFSDQPKEAPALGYAA